MKLPAAILCLLLTAGVALAATQEEEARLLQAVQDACAKKDVSKLVAIIGNYQAVGVNFWTVSNLFHGPQIISVRYDAAFLPELTESLNEQNRLFVSTPFPNPGPRITVTPNPAITHCLRIDLQNPFHRPLSRFMTPFVFRIYFGEENGRLVPVNKLKVIKAEWPSHLFGGSAGYAGNFNLTFGVKNGRMAVNPTPATMPGQTLALKLARGVVPVSEPNYSGICCLHSGAHENSITTYQLP